MKVKYFLVLLFCIMSQGLLAQGSAADSLNAAKALNVLVTICRAVDFSDPMVSKLGTFYKAAPFIVYRGDDKIRAWKDFTNYENADEKKGVDQICLRINQTLSPGSDFKIVKYSTEKESEGIWHVLTVSYNKKGGIKKAAFAFLKINNRFGLGDID